MKYIFLIITLMSLPFTATAKQLPEFTQQGNAKAWINSPPLQIKELRGSVLLIDFWTFDCWNCYRSFPWLREVEEKFKHEKFQVIGIHSPEFEHEHKRENVVEKVAQFRLDHPIMLDNDFAYWKKMNNQYWPSYYIVDKSGNIRGHFIGETHSGDKNSRKINALIKKLLAE